MGRSNVLNDLADGLGALELFARVAPIDVMGYARAGRFGVGAARALMETFEAGGYIKRVPLGDLFVLHPMAMKLVLTHNLIGTLVARAIPRVKALGIAMGVPAALSIRRGTGTLCVLASESDPRLTVGAITPLLGSTIGEVFSAFNDERRFGCRDRLREQGYGLGGSDEGGLTLAIPLLVQKQPVAVLSAHLRDCEQRNPAAELVPALLQAGRQMLPQTDHPPSGFLPSGASAPASVH